MHRYQKFAVSSVTALRKAIGSQRRKSLQKFKTQNCSKIFVRTMAQVAEAKKNLLQYEKSPYLLQHQYNPVQWYPWNSETLMKAKSENKLIFLSVGYSTCHWCHVMERESFENPRIAEIMNANFINIKMDREERPDIDRIYMTFVQAVSGSGGWPMSVWMTPDLLPIYGGTYYPPEDRYFGRPGFRALLLTIAEQWSENEDKCIESARKIMEVMERSAMLPPAPTISAAEETSLKCVQQLTRSFEPTYGGFSEQPKFPQPVNLLFLIDYAGRCSDQRKKENIIQMINKTLIGMAKGGIHDHIGMGFARYSTDKKWHVPHFEKMLYDQAQLTVAYSNAFLLTKNQVYASVVTDILTYVDRDLGHQDGGFFAAEDADSLPNFPATEASASGASHAEKKEGAFYVWTHSDLLDILAKQSSNGNLFADLFSYRYGVKENGNVDPYQDPHDELKNQNVLFEAHTLEETAEKFSLSPDEVTSIIEECRTTLFNYRNINRPRPGLDTKVITSWNSLMISGYAKAGRALKNANYIGRAEKAFQFLQKHSILESKDVIRTCYTNVETKTVENLKIPILGCVDDFSNLICACIELYQSTFKWDYLKIAEQLQEKQNELFQDTEKGGYFNSRLGDSSIIVRFKDDDDGAEPSANSTSLINLLRLNTVSSKDYTDTIITLLKQFSDRLGKIPITLPLMASILPFVGTSKAIPGPLTVLITGSNLMDSEFVQHINSKLLPIGSLIIGFDASSTQLKDLDGINPEVMQICSGADSSQIKVYVKRSKEAKFAHVSDVPNFDKLL